MNAERSRESIKVSGPELLNSANSLIFDVDGILAHSAKTAVSILKKILVKRFGNNVDLNFSESQIEKYGQLTEWALERGLGSEEALGLESTLWDSPEVLGNTEAIDGAGELVSWLIKKRKKKVKAHTSRPPEAAEITKNFLAIIGRGKKIPLSIRTNGDPDRHMFKAINAAAEAANYGRILVFEDMSSHAMNILNFADRRGADVWALLVPYGITPVPPEVLAHPRLICIERRSENQGIERVYRYLKGEPI